MSKIHQALLKADQVRQGRKDLVEGIKRQVIPPPSSEESKIENEAASSPETLAPMTSTISSVELDIQAGSKLVSYLDPKSIASEQYRALKTKVFQLHQAHGFKTLLVTGAGISEGKTTTATNLALTMAQEINLKVLLMDGDLRRPSIHRFLGIRTPFGLSDYLSEKCSVEQMIYGTQLKNFRVVLAGPTPHNPAELLNSQRMRSLMTYVADRFDWVVLDSPPIAALSDADILASMTDGVLVVVRALYTPADLLEKAMDALKGRNVLGIVLNGHEDDNVRKYSYYYYRPKPEELSRK
jgi:capsular exopolysaccharide synthesis family protein